MSDVTTRATSEATAFTPPPRPADLLADALGCIITGRPHPQRVRPPAMATACPTTVAEGIPWLLAGPSRQQVATTSLAGR